MENEPINNAQFDAFLENIAKLIESNASTVEQAADIVRASKASAQTKE